MKYIVGIPYVNRLDLLQKAIESIKPYWDHTLIIDNSDDRDLRGHDLSSKVRIYEPPVPLTFTQSMNYIIRLAEERGCDIWMYMHSDAEAHEGTPETFLSIVESLLKEDRKWAVALTLGDTLAAYNMEAQKEIGYYDTIIRDYFADTDYYYRMELAGYERVFTPLSEKMSHFQSATINSDIRRAFINTITYPQAQAYYELKWGGPHTFEKYKTPFNR
jgi:GT2 family glycosyltransferase